MQRLRQIMYIWEREAMRVAQVQIEKELENIQKVLQQIPAPASLYDIRAALYLDIPIRTLQRRLEKLQQEGTIWATGKTRGTRYGSVLQYDQLEEPAQLYASKDVIPLSIEGELIRNRISLPVQQRKPVGYQRDFLYNYQPNSSFYLSTTEMKRLAALGKTLHTALPAGTYAKEILHRLLIDLSWNSSRLEGNTYTLLDTERLIAQGASEDEKSALDAQMILNHKEAIEFLVHTGTDIHFNRYTLLNLHALLSYNLLPDPAASGRLRHFAAGIHGSVFTPLGVPQQIEEMFHLFLQKVVQIENPFEQAFFVMVHIPYLQPFDDVNKRVSRLAANISLNHHNLAPLSFIDVPNDLYIKGLLGVYELNKTALLKDVFLWAYERSAARYAALRQSLGEPDKFRMQYREAIRSAITNIVSKALMNKEAAALIQQKASELPLSDQSRFIESVETELLSLHEGNFARYYVSPSQFEKWMQYRKKG